MSKEEVKIKTYDIVSSIPSGKVLTYSDVAFLAGVKNPRYIGYLLHHNPDPNTIPCHRVVNAKGQVAKNFAFGMASAQRQLLELEGIVFIDGRIPLSKHRWVDVVV